MIEHTRLDDYKIKNDECSFDPIFDNCVSLFQKSDYVVANLETPVAGKDLGYSYKQYNFNTPTQILDAIKKSGINMVTTANNHCLDRGLEGLDRTIDNIKRTGIDFVGTTHSNDCYKPYIKRISGISIGFLAYTYGTEACYNLHYLNKKDRYRVCLLQNQELSNPIQRFLVRSNSFFAKVSRKIIKITFPGYLKKNVEDYKQKDKYQKQRLLDDISYLKKNSVDYIVMCLHCGGQYNDYPTNYTLETIRYLLENGADFVVCNHEHLIQGSSFLGEKGATYCLGNFTCNYGITRWPWDKQAECSIMFHLYLSKTGGALRKQYAFSVLHSRKNDNGIIVTSPIYDDYVKTNDKKMKKELELLNTKCISRFMGYTSDNVIIPHEEYFVDDLKPNIAGWL